MTLKTIYKKFISIKDERLADIQKSISLSQDSDKIYINGFSISKDLKMKKRPYSNEINLSDLLDENKMLFLITFRQVEEIFSHNEQIAIAYIVEIIKNIKKRG